MQQVLVKNNARNHSLICAVTLCGEKSKSLTIYYCTPVVSVHTSACNMKPQFLPQRVETWNVAKVGHWLQLLVHQSQKCFSDRILLGVKPVRFSKVQSISHRDPFVSQASHFCQSQCPKCLPTQNLSQVKRATLFKVKFKVLPSQRSFCKRSKKCFSKSKFKLLFKLNPFASKTKLAIFVNIKLQSAFHAIQIPLRAKRATQGNKASNNRQQASQVARRRRCHCRLRVFIINPQICLLVCLFVPPFMFLKRSDYQDDETLYVQCNLHLIVDMEDFYRKVLGLQKNLDTSEA